MYEYGDDAVDVGYDVVDVDSLVVTVSMEVTVWVVPSVFVESTVVDVLEDGEIMLVPKMFFAAFTAITYQGVSTVVVYNPRANMAVPN
jgi:hypothetical protein